MNLILKIQKFYYMEKYLIDREQKNMENIKIIFIDIDGTLADDASLISEENKEALKKLEKNQIIPVLCSGRTRNTVKTRCEEIGVSNTFICSNGAEIFDVKSQETIYLKHISNFIIKMVFNFCQKRNIGIMLRTTSKAYVNMDWKITNKRYNIIENYMEISEEKIVRIKFKVEERKVLNLLLIFLRLCGIKVTTKEEENENSIIGVCKSNINKGTAIKRYLKMQKINPNYACAIGNDYNDISMFKKVKYRVAMANSIKKLKNKANYITLSNNDNGVSFFINEKIFRGK